MALIGLGAVTVVAVIAYVRSSTVLNKTGVAVMWGAFTAVTAGVV